MPNTYGDISPRTAAYASAMLLERAEPFMCMARFGQQHPIPANNTLSIKWRRYNGFVPNTNPLSEGVTPAPDSLSHTDVNATLQQYGRYVRITDVIEDTHEDPVLTQHTEIMGELAGQTAELVVYNVLKAGTNQLFSGGTSRATVNAAITTTVLNRAIRQLKRQNAKMMSKMLAGTDKVGTAPIRPAFVAFCHPDVQTDIEALTGFKTPSEYGTYNMLADNEFGSYKEIRFFGSTLYAPFLAAATTTGSGSTFMTNGGTGTGVPDVYPMVICGADSYGVVSLAGNRSVTPMVSNPKVSESDPLAQRGSVGFKMYGTAAILNDAWMVRIETAVNQ